MNTHRLLPLAAALLPLFGHAQTPAPQQLEPVLVLGHYENSVGSSDAASEGSVTTRLIANRPALRPGELLEFVPGVIVTQHSGDGKANQYFLRGFNLDHGTDFASFVDGMPVNMVSHAHGQGYSDLNFVIPELVQRIHYRKGPYAASEGDFSLAGSARLSLSDALPRGLSQLTLGQHGYRRALLANSTALSTEAGAGTLLGALELQGNNGPWQQPEDLHKLNGWLRFSQRGEGTLRSLTAMAYNSRWTATDQVPQRALDAGLIDRFGTLDASDGGRTQRLSLSAQQTTALPDGSWQANAYLIGSRLNLWSNFSYATDTTHHDGDQFEQAERRRVLGGALSRIWDVKLAGRDTQLTLGAQVRHDRLAPVGLYDTAQRVRSVTQSESRVQQTLLGVYGELAAPLVPQLRGVAGLRADSARFAVNSSTPDLSGHASDTQLSPKLSLIAGPWGQTEFFANLGRGFHSNDARSTTHRTQGVTPLAPGRGAELGLRSEAVPGLQSSLALWRLDLASELVYIGDAGVTEESGASRRHGVEWNNHWRLDAWGLKGWLLDADFAASQARYKNVAPEASRVPGAVNRVVSLGLGYGDVQTPWSAQFQLRHFGPRDLVEDGSVRSASTTLAYLRGGWRVNPRVSLNVDVFNLFKRQASDIDYVYESQLPGEAAPVTDRHLHPVEPRSLRVTLALQW